MPQDKKDTVYWRTRHQPVTYYLCRYGHWDVVKIGTTVNLSNRLDRYFKKNPFVEWHILKVEAGNVEGKRHTQFSKSKIQGEWFWMTPDLKEHIDGIENNLMEECMP